MGEMFRRLTTFQRLALSTTATTYFLILVGGLVRASGAGLGCPDWPRCFGSWIPPSSVAALPPQFDPSQFNPTLMWTEYVNRLLGVSVGLLILATVVSAWRHHRRDPRILWTSVAALLLTGFQGWLGGRVVAHDLAPWIVTAHMVVALVIVSLLLVATVYAFAGGNSVGTQRAAAGDDTRHADRMLSRSIVVLMAVTLVQVALGTQVRGRVDAALDLAVPRIDALATVGMLDHVHRDGALVVFAGSLLVMLILWSRRPDARILARWAYAVVGLAFAQIALGAVLAYIALAPAAQVGHLTVASLLLGAETVLWLLVETPG